MAVSLIRSTESMKYDRYKSLCEHPWIWFVQSKTLTQSYVVKIDVTNGTLKSSTTEFNFIKIKPITDSRGKNGTFDSSITNVWGPARELQIKMGLKKRLSKKTKSKNVKRIEKDEFIVERRKVMLRFVPKRNYKSSTPHLFHSVTLSKETQKRMKELKIQFWLKNIRKFM